MIKESGLKTQKGLSNALSASEPYITKWKKQGYIPDEYIDRYNTRFSEFFTAPSELEQKETNNLLKDINIINQALNCKATNLVSINYYEDIYASAGLGSYAEEYMPIVMEFDKNFLEKILNVKRFDNLDIIRVTGDSMLPYIKDGEFIIVERCSEAKSGDTVIANIDGELYVKRLKKVPFEKWLILESENHEYSPIELNTMAKLEALTIIGIMRSKIKLY